MAQECNFWFVKTDYFEYSCEEFEKERTAMWEGVRNFQARNFISQMRFGDKVLVFHAKCREPGLYCLGVVIREAYPDPSQFDPGSKYFDPRAKQGDPIWLTFDMGFERRLYVEKREIDEILQSNKYYVRQKRLTVFPLSKDEVERIFQASAKALKC